MLQHVIYETHIVRLNVLLFVSPEVHSTLLLHSRVCYITILPIKLFNIDIGHV